MMFIQYNGNLIIDDFKRTWSGTIKHYESLCLVKKEKRVFFYRMKKSVSFTFHIYFSNPYFGYSQPVFLYL